MTKDIASTETAKAAHADVEIQGIAGRYKWALGCPCKACAEVLKIAKNIFKHQQRRLTKKHHTA